MKIRFMTVILTALLAATTLYAAEKTEKEQANKQTVTLIGEVYDSFTKGKVKAFVTLMDTDSTVVDTVTCETMDTRTWSYFTIKVPRVDKKYIIKTTAEGYEDAYTDYEVVKPGRNRWLEIPDILMKRTRNDVYKDVDLEGVVVKGTRIQVAYRDDTIVYDASAFKLPEGSMLDGLIRQLPGAELKDNGDIYINGKKIDFLTLNGKEFFKGDNKVMLENLPYFTVKDLKVFYRDTERNKMLGKEVDEKEYVMDVTLKREYARGYLVNAEAGVGTENRWMAKAFGMFYDDHTRVSLYGNANNVNEERTPGSDGNWDPKKVSDGVRKTRQVGMNLTTEDKEKNIDENLNVKLSWSDTDNETVRFSETFADNGSIFSDRWSANTNRDFRLLVTNNLYLKKTYIGMYSSLRYANNRFTGISNDSTYTTALTNRNENISVAKRRKKDADMRVICKEYAYRVSDMGEAYPWRLTGTATQGSRYVTVIAEPLDGEVGVRKVEDGVFSFSKRLQRGQLVKVMDDKAREIWWVINDSLPVHLNMNDGTVEGSDLNKRFLSYQRRIRAMARDVLKYATYINGYLTIVDEAGYNSVVDSVRKIQYEAVTDNKDNIIPAFFLPDLCTEMPPQLLDSVMRRGLAYSDHLAMRPAWAFYEGQKLRLPGQKYHDVELQDTMGNTHRLSEYVGKGNYVLLHFWSTWAGSARKELKTIKDIVRKYKDKPLTVIGISLNKNGTDWKNYVSARGLKWTHLSNIKEFDSPAARAYGVVSMPMTVLIAPDGTIVSQGIQHERLPETLRQLIP